MPARVYIGKLSDSAREKDVERFFRDYGRVRDIVLKNGYGFVEFEDERDADDAVYDLNGKDLCGERVKLEHARGTSRRAITTSSRARPSWLDKYGPPVRTGYRITVQNLSSRVSWQDLKDYMRQAGEVTYADAHKERKNEGVVEFATYGDMKNALVKLENLEIHGRKIKLVEEKQKGRRRRSSSRSRSRSRSRRSRSRSARRSHRRSRSRSPRKSRSHSRKSRSRSARRSRSRSPRDSTHRSTHDSPHASRHDSPQASPHDGARRSTHNSESRSPRKSQSRSRSPLKSRSRSPLKSRSRSPLKSRSPRRSPSGGYTKKGRSRSRGDSTGADKGSRSRSRSPMEADRNDRSDGD